MNSSTLEKDKNGSNIIKDVGNLLILGTFFEHKEEAN